MRSICSKTPFINPKLLLVSKLICVCPKIDSTVENRDEHSHAFHHVSTLGYRQRLLHSFRQFHQLFLQLNMFKRSAVLFDVKQKIWATRIYLLLLIIAFCMLTIHSLILVQGNSRTIQNPSHEQFESLHSKYAPALSCPCSELSVRYSSMITMQPSFHQSLFKWFCSRWSLASLLCRHPSGWDRCSYQLILTRFSHTIGFLRLPSLAKPLRSC